MSARPPADLGQSGGTQNGDIETAVRLLEQEAKEAMSFGQRGARDVTEEFAAAANQLKPGQLVKDEYFTLFEAVGALEV
ncbi:hypothetical protein KC318_g20336, partial [Hortaea werneckii]